MAEESRPWAGVVVGDAGPYSDDDWDDIWEVLFGSGAAPYNDRGVIRDWANELEVTDGGANTADVDTGAALVHGKFYNHTAPVINLAIPSSVGAWREDLVCLQSDWTAQTIRIYRHANPADDPATYPAPTQTDGDIWEIPLAAVRINAAGGIIGITDLRDYVSDLMQPKELQVHPRLEDGSSAAITVFGNEGIGVYLDVNEHCYFGFVVPRDFKQFRQAVVIVSPDGTGNLDWWIDAEWGGCGENFNTHNDGTLGTEVVTLNQYACIDVSAAFDGPPLAPGDIVNAEFGLDIASPQEAWVFKLLFRYG